MKAVRALSALFAAALLILAFVVGLLSWRGLTASGPSAEMAALYADSPIAPYERPRPPPPVRFVDGEGRPATLERFRGKVVLLNLWAAWCLPCRTEMPSLDRLQARLGGVDFQVMALSVDREGADAIVAFYRDIGIGSLEIFFDATGRVMRDWRIEGLPTTLLIDRQGRALGVKIGPAEWDDAAVEALIRAQIDAGERQTASPRAMQ